MSPEQVEGRTVDQRSDIYSLAVILYEMLTGQIPFSGETVLDIALKHKTQKPDNPQQINKKIPDALADLILHSMAKDPKERYQSAEELLKALMSIEETLPESERSAMRIVPRLGVKKTAQLSFKKMFFPTAAGAAIVIIALITWRLLFPPQKIDVLEGRPTLAVLYFKNNTGDPSFDQWKDRLPEMLTHDLMQSKYLSVVSQDQIYSFLDSKGLLEVRNYTLEDLKELAKEVRANYFAQGFLTKSGENFSLSVQIQDAKNVDPIGAVDVYGRGTESFPSMVDDLTPKIKPFLGITTEDISTDFDENIADVTCPFPAAYDFYIKARRAKIEGRHEEAIELLDKAVALDPDFATAYRLMSEIYLSADLLYELGLQSGVKRAAEAHRQADEAMQRRKVTERERLFIEAYNYHFAENWDKKIEKFEELLAIYPDDYDANHNIALALVHGENFEMAIKYYEAASISSLATWEDFGVLGQIYALNQQYKKAREIYRLGLEKFPEIWNFKCMIAASYCAEGQYERALAECENMYLANPLAAANCQMRGMTLIYMEDFQAAEEEYKKLLEGEIVEERTLGRELLILLYKLQGRFKDILKQVELSKEDPSSWLVYYLIDIFASQGNFEAAEKALGEWIPWDWKNTHIWKPYLTGIINVKMKRWDEAIEIVDNLNDFMRKQNWTTSKLLNRLTTDLQGRIELERENYGLAIEYLERAKELVPGFNYSDYLDYGDYAWYLEALARSYLDSGNLEQAREEYELITTLHEGRYTRGDIYARSFYMLGKIAEEFGEKEKAKKQYTRFLEIWKDADPGLSEVEDAKKRLASLRSN
jgi:tetratricopeptide (TPR) repeat protein